MTGVIQGVMAAFGGMPTIDLVISSTTTNYNLFTAAGSPTSPSKVNLTINNGVTVGGTGSSTALTVGQFPSGSIITINNNGNIDGYGGAAGTSGVGGNGGDAIKADYSNQQVVINNAAGANIRGGGGGGGRGGNGGTGGQGLLTEAAYKCIGYYPGSCDPICTANGYSYCGGECSLSAGQSCCDACIRNVITSGGAGGAGGNGGAGQGYNQASGTGVAGANGSAGGTNAGAGGKGGTGGNGASFGSNGSSGATGSTGANGTYSNGSAGVSGSTGGTAGRYLVKGSADVTLNNSGTVAGGLA